MGEYSLADVDQIKHLKELWKKYDVGDVGDLSEDDLRTLLKTATQGYVYLVSRSERLATYKTIQDINNISGILDARKVYE